MPGDMETVIGAKLITVYPENAALGVQSHQGFLALFEPDSGAPVAVIHAGEVTANRTAAASAAATQALARPDAQRLAIIGTGEQALAHAEALAKARPFTELRLWGRSADKARSLAARLQAQRGLSVAAFADVEEALRRPL